MDKFTTLTGVAAPMPMQNIDTDKVIPARFLKTIKRTGLGVHLFDALRYQKDGSENPDFVLNQEPYRHAEIIIAYENFGCGSSREHAPIAIKAAGVSCVVAKNFARIFYRNSFNTGLPIFESAEAVDGIKEGDEVEVDANRGIIRNLTTNKEFTSMPVPAFMQELIAAGGLMAYTKKKAGLS